MKKSALVLVAGSLLATSSAWAFPKVICAPIEIAGRDGDGRTVAYPIKSTMQDLATRLTSNLDAANYYNEHFNLGLETLESKDQLTLSASDLEAPEGISVKGRIVLTLSMRDHGLDGMMTGSIRAQYIEKGFFGGEKIVADDYSPLYPETMNLTNSLYSQDAVIFVLPVKSRSIKKITVSCIASDTNAKLDTNVRPE